MRDDEDDAISQAESAPAATATTTTEGVGPASSVVEAAKTFVRLGLRPTERMVARNPDVFASHLLTRGHETKTNLELIVPPPVWELLATAVNRSLMAGKGIDTKPPKLATTSEIKRFVHSPALRCPWHLFVVGVLLLLFTHLSLSLCLIQLVRRSDVV
jgi:hypothetical protein